MNSMISVIVFFGRSPVGNFAIMKAFMTVVRISADTKKGRRFPVPLSVR